jgi:hypothetical protein
MGEAGKAFSDVPRDARGHLGLLFYEAAYHLICYLVRRDGEDAALDRVFQTFPFLRSYFAQIQDRMPAAMDWPEALEWLRVDVEGWEGDATPPLPMVDLCRTLDLPHRGALIFVLAGMVEEEAHFAALFSTIGQSSEQRASVGLVQQVFSAPSCDEPWQLLRSLIDSGFLQVMNRDAPRSQWILRVPTVLWNAVRGECATSPLTGVTLRPRESLRPLAAMILDAGVRGQLEELERLATSGRTQSIVFRGLPGTDRIGAAGAVAQELGYGLLEIECTAAASVTDERWRLLGPLCTLSRTIPAFAVEAGPGETFEVPALAGYTGPCAVLIGRDGGVGGAAASQGVTVHLELESPADRLVLWTRALNGQGAPDLSKRAADLCLPGRYIAHCARLAIDYATIDRRDRISMEDVRRAARAINRQVLDTLAARVDGQASWPQLVVREETYRELTVLEGRCRHRERLASAFGASFPGGMNRGVRASFEGPSGTGKTLAARVLANELALDLYRVDLAAVVNKYIGETEKNLSRVLSRAEDLNVILLLDEGDSLMSRRTEVKSSNDRAANLETNYLLQRLETYTGIVIVTTNAGNSIDPAFRRRMDTLVKFHLPDAAERWQLWRAHLPADHQVGVTALEDTAARYEFTGGQIRNISIRAALLAMAREYEGLNGEDLKEAIHAEQRKAGASFIEDTGIGAPRNDQSLAAFLGGLS